MITPLESNGMISRVQDISIIKHNEDSKSELVQQHSQSDFDTRQDQNVHTVHSADDTSSTDTHHDAREKGRNEYFDQRKKEKKKAAVTDRVIAKPKQGFDIKI